MMQLSASGTEETSSTQKSFEPDMGDTRENADIPIGNSQTNPELGELLRKSNLLHNSITKPKEITH